jgi:hypothetical protein
VNYVAIVGSRSYKPSDRQGHFIMIQGMLGSSKFVLEEFKSFDSVKAVCNLYGGYDLISQLPHATFARGMFPSSSYNIF